MSNLEAVSGSIEAVTVFPNVIASAADVDVVCHELAMMDSIDMFSSLLNAPSANCFNYSSELKLGN